MNDIINQYDIGTIERWIEARVVKGVADRLSRKDAMTDLLAHCNGFHIGPQRFVQAMHSLGYASVRASHCRYFVGIKLRGTNLTDVTV